MNRASTSRLRAAARQVAPRLLAAGHGLATAALSLTVNTTLFALMATAVALVPVLGIGVVLVPLAAEAVRWRADLERRLARWYGVDIPSPYRPVPAAAPLGSWQRFRHVAADPATWRDFAWLLPGAIVSGLLGIVAISLTVYGLEGTLFVPVLLYHVLDWYGYGVTWPLDNLTEALLTAPQGVFLLVLGLVVAPALVRTTFRFSRLLLAPTASALLQQRVERLTTTREATVDAQAAELRRIERDLHDGTQARLVSLGINIGLAEELLHRNPQKAQQLLVEAREASGQALGELREVVRGIHPPVLAERGLEGAVVALALTLPIPVRAEVALAGKVEAPVESAAYFAIAEALANVVKHSRATSAAIDVMHHAGLLTMRVTDDGVGGADPTGGSGLRGIERRLAAFDGRMMLSSPVGGPTIVTMELPCVLSSPRTSPSSGTA